MSGAAAGDVLAQLMRQGAERGCDLVTLRAIAEEAGELGAGRAMARLGLADEGAGRDVRELRELLSAWREARRSAWKAAVGWVARVATALVLAALAVRLGIDGWGK